MREPLQESGRFRTGVLHARAISRQAIVFS